MTAGSSARPGYPVIEVIGGQGDNLTRRVLIPFSRAEALSLRQAAEISGKSVETIRRWCALHDLGRRIGGQWCVSRVALAMWLDGDLHALRLYLAGDRSSTLVLAYFERADLISREVA
jgi:hypothetical protein